VNKELIAALRAAVQGFATLPGPEQVNDGPDALGALAFVAGSIIGEADQSDVVRLAEDFNGAVFAASLERMIARREKVTGQIVRLAHERKLRGKGNGENSESQG
jgi:hypothetical protein